MGPSHCPPTSMTWVLSTAWFRVRPPTRSRASSRTTSCPRRARSRAAVRPARPAPTTTTSAVVTLAAGAACTGSSSARPAVAAPATVRSPRRVCCPRDGGSGSVIGSPRGAPGLRRRPSAGSRPHGVIRCPAPVRQRRPGVGPDGRRRSAADPRHQLDEVLRGSRVATEAGGVGAQRLPVADVVARSGTLVPCRDRGLAVEGQVEEVADHVGGDVVVEARRRVGDRAPRRVHPLQGLPRAAPTRACPTSWVGLGLDDHVHPLGLHAVHVGACRVAARVRCSAAERRAVVEGGQGRGEAGPGERPSTSISSGVSGTFSLVKSRLRVPCAAVGWTSSGPHRKVRLGTRPDVAT